MRPAEGRRLSVGAQSIRQLMGCEGEESAPTRQNIKSHLQKYRLLLLKQAGGSSQHCEASSGQDRCWLD